MELNLFDRFLMQFSPRAVALRQYWRVRAQRLYEAGSSSNYRKRPKAQGTPDNAMDQAREKVRDWARHLDENHDLAIGVLDELVNKVVGAGLAVEPLAASARGKPNEKFNRDVQKLWHRWTMKPEVTGEIAFAEVQRLVCRAWFRDGEMLIQHVMGNQGRIQHLGGVPYSLELIEADYLPFDMIDKNRGITHGVEKNAWGRPRAYHLLKEAPDNVFLTYRPPNDNDTKRVTADRISHVKFTRRAKQTRGVSVFHGVAHRLDDIKSYEESERVAALVASNFTAYIRKGADYDPTKGAEAEGERHSDYREMELTAGMIFDDLLPGEEIGTIDTSRPNTGLNDYRNAMLRAIACGTGTSYSAISKNWDGSYSASRQEMVESTPSYTRLREYFISAFMRPVYQHFIDAAVLSGALTVPRGVDPMTIADADFIAPSMPWIDPKKEVEADILAIDNGLKTRAQVIRERTGRDPAQVMEQIALEIDTATPAQSQAEPAPAPEPEAPPADDDDEASAA